MEEQGITTENTEDTSASVDKDPFQIDKDNPLAGATDKEIRELMKKIKELTEFSQSVWEADKKEFNLSDAHMKALYEFNLNNRSPEPEKSESAAEEDGYDRFNGIDKIEEKDVIEIFGEDHSIIGVTHEVTIERIKTVLNDFITWISVLKEYQNVHNGYIELIEFQEEVEINKLKEIAEKETDEEKKAKLLENIERYYYIKYLDFLREPIDEFKKTKIIETFSNEKKVQYWIEKGTEKLKQLSVSPKFILEISQLEKRFLEEKYHKQNNIFLLYFLATLNYTKLGDKQNPVRSQIVAIVITMDKFIRRLVKDETKERILSNIIELENQFIGNLPEK